MLRLRSFAEDALPSRLARAAAAALLSASLGCAAGPVSRREAALPAALPEPPAATLVVRSNVYGDAVAIDGRPVGPTGPAAHELAPGRHTVTVTKPGYAPWTTGVDLLAGEVVVLRAVLEADAAPHARVAGSEAGWEDTVEFLREKLQDRWAGGEPPAAFGVTDEGVMGFQVRNPADAEVWHRYTVDVRDLAVVPVENAPSVVSLRCVEGTPCIRQRICRGDDCTAGDFTSHHRWFFEDAAQGAKVARACDHLIELARRRPAPKRPVRELF